MTLRQLEVFLAVAQAKSFRGATERLALSQPGLSQHIKELEEDLGAPLFDRLGRSVSLTEAGRLLEAYAQRLFATAEDAKLAIGELRGLRRGKLQLGGSTTPGIYLLPPIIGKFHARYPEIEVSLRIANTREIEREIQSNGLDLGIVGGHIAEERETCVEANIDDELVLIVPPTHRLFRRREVAPAELAKERLIMRESGSATRQVAERLLRKAGVELKAVMELGHTEAIKQGVMAGLGVAIVSIHAVGAERRTGRLGCVRFKGLPLCRHFHVIRHQAKRLSPAARAFIELLQSETKPLKGQAPRDRRTPAKGEPS
ncbi:MAG: selenium metabolism-associated LysR family transcriptional regulator [candidate division NC10 bacterium]